MEGRRDGDLGEPAVADSREIERLEAEIERKEEQLRCVTRRYEDLIAEKNRKLADASDADSDSDRRTTLRSRLTRLLHSLR
ncbi:V-type ATPase 116kDa subunit family protein [Halorubrum salsamenti]|uniref:V-type ATPase 116kDa subunit family protein n=1 Tax=Halorubrum salsamenti TaxID=2583990 RepID=UPI0011A86987|nr:V-type ATPase 116kDa subunit family protein [Halorubrum salsamenti]